MHIETEDLMLLDIASLVVLTSSFSTALSEYLKILGHICSNISLSLLSAF